jgi:hypothetical protein
MTDTERQALMSALGQFVVDEIARALVPVHQQLMQLGLKLENAELRVREMRYAGSWSAQSKYRRGNFVTHNGALWACLIDDIATIPGHDFLGWQLAAKNMTRAEQ